MVTTWISSILITFTMEFPLTRLYQITILPKLTHDSLLRDKFKMNEIAMKYYSPARMKEF
jgi:hypothetical protein